MKAPLIELSSARFEPGYWRGMRQPAVLVPLRLTQLEVTAQAIQRFDALMAAVRTLQAVDSSGLLLDEVVAQHPILSRVLNLALVVLNTMGMPVMGGATAHKSDAKNAREWMVGLPAIAQGISAPQAAFKLACVLMNALAAGKNAGTDAVAAAIAKLVKQYRPLAPGGINTLRFLQAAHEMGVPWRHVANNVYQFGWGSRSRWLDSSFTDQTSGISAGLARDKVACAMVLRDAGLPVPRHQLVGSAEQAVKVADALGYPVVVKPANLDGGAGVMAGLRGAEAVAKAFAMAEKHSKKILVEQFIEGEDYRIRICAGEVIGAVIRKAASVVGDGQRTIRALIKATNAERAKQLQPYVMEYEHGTKPIVVDEEVQAWLQVQGVTLDSVAPQGLRVRLRGAANVSLGGTTWDVTERAHPDNLDLALRAAAALRLDVAGVDLLLPDIGQSWKVTGGAICEVNGQPQFSSGDAHRKVLERLVPHRGRIPVVAIQQALVDTRLLDLAVGLLHEEGIYVEIVITAMECRQALMRSHTDALIWLMERPPINMDGLPMDEIDVLIHAADFSNQPISAQWAKTQQSVFSKSSDSQELLDRLRDYLREACRHSKA